MTTDPEALLAPDLIDRLSALPIEDVRAQRAACIEVETGLSYQRRLVQGPIDIVSAELERRAEGGRSSLRAILESLPSVLSDGPRNAGNGRLPTSMEPTSLDPEFTREIDDLVGDGRLGRLPDLSDDELRSLASQLGEVERRLSERRRRFHERIDAFQGELTRRYASGEASVDTLFTDS